MATRKVDRFNTWLALVVTRSVGTMWCAYAFLALDLVELPPVIHEHSVVLWISYITQTVFQLVLLPIIIVGQNLQAKHTTSLHAKVDSLHRKHDLHTKKLDAIHKTLKKGK